MVGDANQPLRQVWQHSEQRAGRSGQASFGPRQGEAASLPSHAGRLRTGSPASQHGLSRSPTLTACLCTNRERCFPQPTSTHAPGRITPPALSTRSRATPASPDLASEPRPPAAHCSRSPYKMAAESGEPTIETPTFRGERADLLRTPAPP